MDELRTIGEGWNGTDQTVEAVYELVNQGILDPLVIREARKIVIHVPERNQALESRAISNYVRSHLRYTKESVETLTSPREMIEWVHRYGKFPEDCDGAVILWMTLHKAIGIPVRAQVISQRADGIASHIFAQVLINGRWITDDTIVKKKPYGWSPPQKSRTATKSYSVQGLGGVGCPRRRQMEDFPMPGLMIGRTRVIRSDDFAPRREFIRSLNMAPQSFQLKPSGMLYVDRGGDISGVGVHPSLRGETLGQDFSAIATAVTNLATKGAETYGKIQEAQLKLKGLKATQSKGQAPQQKCPAGYHPSMSGLGAT